MSRLLRAATLTSTLILAACAVGASGPKDPDTPPGLKVGDRAPDVQLMTIESNPVQLGSKYANGPTVVTFYRGGWCPYCNKALQKLQERLPEFEAAGAQIIAVTTEKPTNAGETAKNNETAFWILSDTDLEASRQFKVLFSLDDGTISRYKGYGIDLERANASGTWDLPAPATYVIDRDGVIRWVWADWDYTKRADPDEILAAVRALR